MFSVCFSLFFVTLRHRGLLTGVYWSGFCFSPEADLSLYVFHRFQSETTGQLRWWIMGQGDDDDDDDVSSNNRYDWCFLFLLKERNTPRAL